MATGEVTGATIATQGEIAMRKFLIVTLTGALLAGASMTSMAETAQQARMTSCNADAKTKALKGDERKTFMKSCLSGAAPAAGSGNSQQQKMKTCNAEAKTKALKGDERKTFMKTCLSSGG